MTQSQLKVVDFKLNTLEFKDIFCCRHQITCVLRKDITVVVTREDGTIYIQTKTGAVKVPLDVFDCICDNKVSVKYLSSFLQHVK